MQYGITKLFLGYKNFLEISGDEFEEVKTAKRSLLEMLSIEEKLNLILENHAEFERELLGLGLNHMMFFSYGWSTFQNEIHLINRRLINLLTTCRLYMDQIPHNVNSIYGEGAGLARIVKEKMSHEYDSNLSYRVVEALRNYVQHRGLPIYGLEYNMTRKDVASPLLKHIVTPTLSVARLKEEKKFKAAVLKELEALGDEIDIKPLVRQYIDSIGRIHLSIRDLVASDVARWEHTILEIQNRFTETFSDDPSGLAMVACQDLETFTESTQIFDDFIKHRQWLAQKNRFLTHHSLGIITNEVRSHDA